MAPTLSARAVAVNQNGFAGVPEQHPQVPSAHGGDDHAVRQEEQSRPDACGQRA
jgi:hypothetical protein